TCASTGSATGTEATELAEVTATELAEVCPEAGDKGQLREAIVLDGDDSLTVPAATELSLEDFSIALWVKPTQAKDADQWLVRKGTSSGYQRNYGLALVTDSDDELHLDFTVQSSCVDSDSNWKFVESADALIENQWNHIVAVHDSSANTMQLYINGTLDAEKTPGFTGTCTADQAITIGEAFEGNLDEIAIYGYALEDDEILEIYDYQDAWYDLKYQQLLTVDADDPDLAINLNSDYLSLAESWLSISAVDATSEVESVAVTLTDPNNSVTTGSAALDNQAWLYWFAPTVEGLYTLSVVATDSVGNQTTTTKTIYVDDEPPVATLDSSLTTGVHQPQPSATDGVDELTLFGTLDDSGGIVDSGIVTNSVAVDLLDWQGRSVEGTVYADADGTEWS
ncbi:MAG: LamG domain-containing protein, partial [Caldilineaceae bacterium]|nr:LamG domain-containing protein [Caldilineaceae bacterium]